MLLQKLLHNSPMSSSIYHLFFVLAILFIHPLSAIAQPATPTSRITVVGAVFCDTCSTNSLSRHGYFLPGVDVHIQCKFKASSPKTAEQINFSVNRTTDKYGVYKLEIPHVDGVDCVDGMAIESLCQASLIRSSSSACNIPGLKTATNEISVKSKQDSLCIYSLQALSYRPSRRNATLCGNNKEDFQKAKALNSSKFFLPYYFPPYGFFWPPLPKLPPFPFPPLFPSPPPSFPFPFPFPPLFPSPPPSFPFPPLFPSPPSLPFPFPPLPQFPPGPSLFKPPPPPPPAFNLGDPRTWIPNFPTPAPPPPPAFNLRDPRTWIPNFPTLAPPPPPAFNLRDPRTWIPYIPPSPLSFPQHQDKKP